MSTTWTLLFEPLGVLMFRDHRPFDAGLHGVARSQFPAPSVFRGAVRSALFRAAGADFSKEKFGLGGDDASLLGDGDHPEGFAIRGPFLARGKREAEAGAGALEAAEYLLPWPADLVDLEPEGKFEVMGDSPAAANARCFRWNGSSDALESVTGGVPWVHGPLQKPPHGSRCLTSAGARRYAETEAGALTLSKDAHFIDESTVLKVERRVGLARATRTRGRTLTAAQGMLYTLLTYRLAPNARFAVEVDVAGEHGERLQSLLHKLDGQSVRVGGQAGHARVQLLERSVAPEGLGGTGAGSKLWAWTPTLLDLESPPSGLLRAMGKPVRLGGFDMHRGCPRPLRTALGRGAVLRFSCSDTEAVRDAFVDEANKHHLPPHSYGYGHWSTFE